ncbi:MAG: tetratricopeptide repeat protein [Verrucomicrobiota bacterium]
MMKRLLPFAFLFAFLISLHAQNQDYIQIYNLIGQADLMNERGQGRLATQSYLEAQTALKKLQKVYPKWNEAMVKFRLDDLEEKLSALQPAVTVKTNALPIPKANLGVTTVAPAAGDEIRRLQSEKALLEAKLKEALSVQPATVSPVELAKAEEKLLSTQKERDLLKVALNQNANAKVSARPIEEANEATAKKLREVERERDLLKVALEQEAAARKSAKQISEINEASAKKLKELENERDDLRKKLAAAAKTSPVKPRDDKELQQLRARLEVLEAKPDPYTPEELALFKQPEPQLAVTDTQPPQAKEMSAKAKVLVKEAERAFASKNFEEARSKYLEILKQNPNNTYILGNLAATQIEMNDAAGAEKNINRAIELDAADSFSLTLLGMINFRQGNYDKALDALSRSAKINPENPETQNYLGITLSQKGQRVAAEAALRKAVKIQPNYAGAHHNLAVVYATQKPPFLKLARWHYDKALSLDHAKNPDLEKLLNEQK